MLKLENQKLKLDFKIPSLDIIIVIAGQYWFERTTISGISDNYVRIFAVVVVVVVHGSSSSSSSSSNSSRFILERKWTWYRKHSE